MGRHYRKNKKPRVAGENNTNMEQKQDDRDSYGGSPQVRENAVLQEYYRKLELMPEGEFTAFMETLRSGLPSTFRITGNRQTAEAVQKHLEKKLIPSLPEAYEDGTPCPIPKKIGWYPKGLAWNMQNDRKALRSLPAYGEFHAWLVAAMENGDISRQETVSMIPPLLLDVQGDHLVLDMCAAPGSKTSQIVEAMHSACAPGKMPTGLVIANDVDQKRAYLLHHQVKRILSPCLMVTNNDGTCFPNLFAPEAPKEPLQFDRILADVPCSGDGTIRKNPGLWRDWTVTQGLALHPLQVRLLERAIAMLKVGGRIVYSTCSMNPIEDEAVIAHVLNKLGGKVRLVDCSAELEGLQRLPGHSSWKIISRDATCFYEKHADVPEKDRARYPLSVFPLPEYAELNLDRCMRVLPHLQNTGGFFIAVLEKVEETRAKKGAADAEETNHVPELTPIETASADSTEVEPGFLKNPLEGEYKVIDPAHPNLANILDQYGISSESVQDCGFVSKSSTSPLKLLTIVSGTAQRLLEGCNAKLKVVNLGARAFEIYDVNIKRDFECPYRVLSESAAFFEELGLVTKRRVVVPAEVARTLINQEDSVPLESCGLGPEQMNVVKAIPEGGIMLIAISESGQPVVVPTWKGEKSLKAFIPKANRPALLYQLSA